MDGRQWHEEEKKAPRPPVANGSMPGAAAAAADTQGRRGTIQCSTPPASQTDRQTDRGAAATIVGAVLAGEIMNNESVKTCTAVPGCAVEDEKPQSSNMPEPGRPDTEGGSERVRETRDSVSCWGSICDAREGRTDVGL